jgi:nicotinamide-nucleotide amidase
MVLPNDIELEALARQVAQALLARQLKLATAESCTGGLIAGVCTAIAGSSAWLERGFVTYSNEAKTEMLGVDAALIAQHGAVSEPVARAMAEGALARSHAQVAVAVTGIAGPDGGSPSKPVGTVWFGWAFAPGAARHQPPGAAGASPQVRTERMVFAATGPNLRAEVRAATVAHALKGVLSAVADR